MKLLNTILFCTLLALCSRCTSELAGGGTETTNGISGTVIIQSTGEDRYIPITAALFSIDYRPDSCIGFAESTTVAENGAFVFDPPPAQQYNLFLWDSTGRTGHFVPMLSADTLLSDIVLTQTGTVTTYSATGAMVSPTVEIIITGTPFYFTKNPDESANIPFLPEGDYECLLRLTYSSTTGGNTNELQRAITVDTDIQDTTTLLVP